VRNPQAYLHPDSEHWLDWFHITMRITVLAGNFAVCLFQMIGFSSTAP
jgi:hypothetical protein